MQWADVLKALRAGLLAGVGAFVTGVVGAVPTLDLTNLNPKAIGATLLLAGLTAAFDLVRRFLTDYSSYSAPQA